MTLLTERQFRDLRDLLYVLLSPPASCEERPWAVRCAKMFGTLLDDPHSVTLALHDRGEPRWYGPGQHFAASRALADPRRSPPGLISPPHAEHASVWWSGADEPSPDQGVVRVLPSVASDKQGVRYKHGNSSFDTMFITDSHRTPAGTAATAGTIPRGAGLWWRDEAGALSMTLAFRPARVVHADRRGDVRTSHQTLRLLLDTLCAPFAAAGRVRCAATRRPTADQGAADTGRVMSETLAERYSLTPREVEVTLQLLKGSSNAGLAASLGISENTARHHTERIIGKLGVRSRAEIAWRAVSALAPPDPEPAAALATTAASKVADTLAVRSTVGATGLVPTGAATGVAANAVGLVNDRECRAGDTAAR